MATTKNTEKATTEELQIGEAIYTGMPINPMTADAMQLLYDLGRNDRAFTVQEINGRLYTNAKELMPIDKYAPAPDVFTARTLTGLVDWLRNDVDKLAEKHGTLYVSVYDVNGVVVLSPLTGESNSRQMLAQCVVEMPKIFFDCYIDQEDFVVMMQTHFVKGENRDGVLSIAGNLRMDQDATTADDGMSQRVTVKQGVATVAETTVKNPVMLAPHRTFPEVEQPSSPFVLRFKKEEGVQPKVALFEADSGAWRTEAISIVGKWLKAQLNGVNVVVIA